MNPNGQRFYYTHILASARAYADNTTDTLPNAAINFWYAATTQSTRIGGCSFASLQLVSLDSMYAVVYIDELIGSTYTNVLQDSIITAAAYTQEFSLRSQNAEKSTKLGGRFLVRIKFPAWRTQGTSSATYTAKWLWKP
jgi:hypothetical protein